MTQKPIIGIMACNRTVGVENAHAVMERYVTSVTTFADCHALIIPPQSDIASTALAFRIDGLLLTGSPSNLRPELYGQTGGQGPFDSARDFMSFSMIDRMLRRRRPVFGICRGFQELNVMLGGSLRRDVGSRASEGAGAIDHHAPEGTEFHRQFENYHDVTLSEGGVLQTAYTRQKLVVNSVHYQGIQHLADDLELEATASDGLIEAFSANIGGAQVLGVQWHPEWRASDNPDGQIYFNLLGEAVRDTSVS